MLKSLSISNYALITELNIDFNAGMIVMTGETGAGKSIIVDALSLVQGQRAETRVIKEGEQKSVVEAVFDIGNYHLQSFFDDNELDYNELCEVRREITMNGKSRAFINDTPVSLTVLRDLSNKLIDIHSQHENLLLSTENYQLQVVDMVAKNQRQLSAYQQGFDEWNKAKSELQKLKKEAERQNADLDYLRFQLEQLDEASLATGEQAELEIELETLSHIEEIKNELQQTDMLLSGDEINIPRSLKECMNALQRVKDYLPDVGGWNERLENAYFEIKDIASEITSKQEQLDFEPARLEYVDNRLNTLYSLQKKFKMQSVEELIDLRESYRTQLNRINNFDEELNEAIKKVDKYFESLKNDAEQLTITRKHATTFIVKYLIETLKQLGIPDVNFEVEIKKSVDFTDKGNDSVTFLFSANKNRSVQPVSEIASGGEISRLMLAIKSLLIHKTDLPTIIFDEVDTGVSGEIAVRMGEIMKKMSENTQVIVITHLPQIAAKGSDHFQIYKDSSGNETQTYIRRLSSEERIQELAQMLSGKTVTEAALQNARELMK